MAAGKEIRTKIKSVENTRKITKAMEMVAASKMRKAQERMKAARPYAEKIRPRSRPSGVRPHGIQASVRDRARRRQARWHRPHQLRHRVCAADSTPMLSAWW